MPQTGTVAQASALPPRLALVTPKYVWLPSSATETMPPAMIVPITSPPSHSHCRVKSLELDAGIGGGELPIRLGMGLVSVVLPSCDFLNQDLLVGNAPIETLAGQHTQFGFSHIQPTAVLGGVVPLEALNQATRFGSGECLIE